MNNDTDKNKKIIFASLIGFPNSGKSTLLNAIIGVRVSIVSEKPHTTRKFVKGVFVHNETQVIFIDTPGILRPQSHYLSKIMYENIDIGIMCSDLMIVVIDAGKVNFETKVFRLFPDSAANLPKIIVINKIDLISNIDLMGVIEKIKAVAGCEYKIFPVSATKMTGVDSLKKEIISRANMGEWFHDEFTKSDSSIEFYLSEISRQHILAILDGKLPLSTAVVTDRIYNEGSMAHIYQTIYVKEKRHKNMIVGVGGAVIKKIRVSAMREIQLVFPEKRLSLFMVVKVCEDWDKKEIASELISGHLFDNAL